MKNIILVAALATLAGCSNSDPAPEATPEATAEAVAPTVATTAADGGPSTGTFQVTDADGTVVMEEVKADGTYVSTQDGTVVETGKWEQKAPGTYCYTKDEEGAEQICNTEQVDDQGVWTSENPEGKIATVERVQS